MASAEEAGAGVVCAHGSLKRKCPHCEYDESEREYLARIAKLEVENRRLRNIVERLVSWDRGKDWLGLLPDAEAALK